MGYRHIDIITKWAKDIKGNWKDDLCSRLFLAIPYDLAIISPIQIASRLVLRNKKLLIFKLLLFNFTLILFLQHGPHIHQSLPQQIKSPSPSIRRRIRRLKPNSPNIIKRTRLHKLPLSRPQKRLPQRALDQRNTATTRRSFKTEPFLRHGVGEFEIVASPNNGLAVGVPRRL